MTTTLPSPAVERYLFGFFSIGCLLAGYCVGSSNVTLSQQCAGQFSEDADPETSSKLVAANSVGALAGELRFFLSEQDVWREPERKKRIPSIE